MGDEAQSLLQGAARTAMRSNTFAAHASVDMASRAHLPRTPALLVQALVRWGSALLELAHHRQGDEAMQCMQDVSWDPGSRRRRGERRQLGCPSALFSHCDQARCWG